MKKLILTTSLLLFILFSALGAVIIPDTENSSFTIMASDKNGKDYIVDSATWTVKRNGFQIDQMGRNIWSLVDNNGTTLVAVNATERELSDLLTLYYSNKSINLVTYNTVVSLKTLKSLNYLKGAHLSSVDSQTAIYLGSVLGINFKSISNDTPVNLVNGNLSTGAISDNKYIQIKCPTCGSIIYVNINDYL